MSMSVGQLKEPEQTASRGHYFAPWMLWSLLVVHATLWIIIALGSNWLELGEGGNSAIPDFIEQPVTIPSSPEEVNARMLAAQEAMAGFASWMYLLGLATLLTTVGGTIALINQIRLTSSALKTADAANEIARHSSEWQLRAYLAIEASVMWNARGQFAGLQVQLRNAGPTPIPNGTAELYVGARRSRENLGDMHGDRQHFALGPDSTTKFYVWKDDIQEIFDAHLRMGASIVFDIDCKYVDIFGSSHIAEISMIKWPGENELSFFPANNRFD